MFGQIPDFNDGFEFLRKMWGNAAGMPTGLMPGLQAMTPPMDLDEVDKRIHDLKAVESWLQLNANLLRTTIQGLEVQRATLVALKTVGEALSPEALQSAMENVARAANAPSATPPRWPSAPTPAQPAAGAEGIDPSDLADMAEMEATPDHEDDDMPDDEAPPDHGEQAADRQAGSSPSKAAGPGASAPPQANLWWDMLQKQFNQIASSAAAASLASLNNLGAFGAGQPGGGAAAQGGGKAGSANRTEPEPPAQSGKGTAKTTARSRTRTAAKTSSGAANDATRGSAKASTKAGTKAGTNGTSNGTSNGAKPAGKTAKPARRGKAGNGH